MPATMYLRPRPRAFVLVTDTYALVFRQPTAKEAKANRSVVVAEMMGAEEADLRSTVRCSITQRVEGVLGVVSVPSEKSPVPEIFLIVLASAMPLSPLLAKSTLRPARVTSVEFHSLSSSTWDMPGLAGVDAYDDDDLDPSSLASSSSASQGTYEHPCAGMKKYLESGGFFFAEGCRWDISTRMGEINWIQAERGCEAGKSGADGDGPLRASPLETFDERFVWNAAPLAPFLSFRAKLPPAACAALDAEALLVPVIQGFVGSLPVSTGEWTDGRPEIAALGMLSRLSWKRAGARFRTRGIDDDGQVANFVETEVILATDTVVLSYVQVRGSVPLFWQQPSQGLGTLQQKVEITRPAQATQPPFDKHFLELLEHYHAVHAVNLLGHKDAESMLSSAYSDHLRALRQTLEAAPPEETAHMHAPPHDAVTLTPYDFHAAVKMGGHEGVRSDFANRLREVTRSVERFGWTAIETASGQIIEQQQGVFRVNCLDCLDRTNYVQDVISSITLQRFLASIGSPLASSPTLCSAHRELWADNGDRLSKIYAGTGALNTSATRSGKKTFAGLISDATKSVGRAYINNFQDKGKQTAIDMLLGMMAGQRPVVLFDPIGESVQAVLSERANEYSTSRAVAVWVGTWNLNGKPPTERLDDWLFPLAAPDADIYSIAFQEIVELTAGQILQTDPAKKRMWESYIMEAFASRKGKNEYMLYRSEQLVGTALIIVIRASLASAIRSVESATRKTGLQGLSGNKGGVGIRLNLFDSSVCFMTCHLAAGHSNVAERNADYHTISSSLRFLRGKTIEDHDMVIWAADFNYRVSLPNLQAREYAETDQLDPLLAADQLLQAMDNDEVFVGYDEGPITFRPTYKYDNGSSQYDTSEKARIPAWTDRILFKGSQLRQKEYARAELRLSDHRPVYAVFDATVREVDAAKKAKVADDVVKAIRAKGAHWSGLDHMVADLSAVTLSAKPGFDRGTKPRSVSGAAPRVPSRPGAPPLPVRTAAAVQSPLRRSPGKPAPPAPPASHRQPGTHRPVSRSESGSSLTSMATGDFVMVNSPNAPPLLPSRTGTARPAAPPARPPSANGSPLVASMPKLASPRITIDGLNSSPRTMVRTRDFSTPSLASSPGAPAPVLPPRPAPKPSLDMNGSPPAGLKSPITPVTESFGKEKEKKVPPPRAAKPEGLKGKVLDSPGDE
ncbi:Inositol-1,4,5-trisphosphate 5-phosphatase 1 [Cryptotrichosporon argae]